jgi:hypothetical protein
MTVEELEIRVSHREFIDWIAYYKIVGEKNG